MPRQLYNSVVAHINALLQHWRQMGRSGADPEQALDTGVGQERPPKARRKTRGERRSASEFARAPVASQHKAEEALQDALGQVSAELKGAVAETRRGSTAGLRTQQAS